MANESLWTNFFRPKNEEDELFELISKVFIFRDVGRRDLRLIRELMHIRSYAPQEVVFFEGQPGSGMYIIIEGEVRILLNYGKEREIELVKLKPGDFFGEFSLIDEAPRSATVVTSGPTKLGGFFRPDLMDLIERNPRQGVKIVLNLSEVLTERLRHTNTDLRNARDLVSKLKADLAAAAPTKPAA